jgi:hypothetical protein
MRAELAAAHHAKHGRQRHRARCGQVIASGPRPSSALMPPLRLRARQSSRRSKQCRIVQRQHGHGKERGIGRPGRADGKVATGMPLGIITIE